jgi:hypothetical protein
MRNQQIAQGVFVMALRWMVYAAQLWKVRTGQCLRNTTARIRRE